MAGTHRAGVPLLIATGAVLGAAALAGCWGNFESPFPPGLEPLEENTAPAPQGTADDPYPEQLEIVSGVHLDYDWAHGRGYVQVPAALLWATLHDPMVVADRRNTDDQSFEIGVEPEFDHSYQIHYVTQRVITIEWQELWRFGVVEGSAETPGLAMIRYQKVWGTGFIDLIEGSLILVAVDDDVTEVQLVKRVRATAAGTAEIEEAFRDLYASMRAAARGQPLPEY